MNEQWRDIEEFEGLYQVSNEGRVKSLGNNKFGVGKVLKARKLRNGYLVVTLYKDGKQKTKQVHRLVAEAFLDNPQNLPQVNHKDENKTNNNVENLEWCNASYNINYGTRTERTSKPVYQYDFDWNLVNVWPSTQECGRNGFDQGNVAKCCNGKFHREGNNKYKGYRWSYSPL